MNNYVIIVSLVVLLVASVVNFALWVNMLKALEKHKKDQYSNIEREMVRELNSKLNEIFGLETEESKWNYDNWGSYCKDIYQKVEDIIDSKKFVRKSVIDKYLENKDFIKDIVFEIRKYQLLDK